MYGRVCRMEKSGMPGRESVRGWEETMEEEDGMCGWM